jgi:plastocyanin
VLRSLLAAVALAVALAAPAHALPGARISEEQLLPSASYPGMQTLRYEFGPIEINPGQNTIEVALNDLKPEVPGYITRFSPGLVYTDTGETPRVDVVHLHHGVWLIDGYPTFAAGEEKTIGTLPQGYGFRHDPSQVWLMNHMVHNLRPDATSVKITYDIDFVPESEAAAEGIVPVRPLWLDVAGLKPYPVFDALRKRGRTRYTFPDDARGAAREDIGPSQEWRADRDITLVATAGHLHPGGLYNDLDVEREGQRKRLFRSRAKYFEPAGAVSWDVAMTHTRPEWRVAVRAGDTLSTSATYDVSKASWYESMGIMIVFYAEGIRPGAEDPFAGSVDTQGLLTHGHLPENDNHGGDPFGLPDPRRLLTGPPAPAGGVRIRDFVYGRGDLSVVGRRGRPPRVRPGGRLRFTNLDATRSMTPQESAYHTITACRAPCNRSTGIAYPLADAPARVNFDSGQLGYGPSIGSLKFTSAAQRDTWSTPRGLPKGTYAYFCRVHPFMRGAFRVGRK